jgi:hypothetical protein
MLVFDALWHLDMRDMHCINDALLVLLPKTTKARAIKDYRPISLIHSFGKLMSKVLANQLASRIGEMVHPSQSAFITGRAIQGTPSKRCKHRLGYCILGRDQAYF